MEFQILGPLEVRAAGGAVPLAGARPRAVLAMLIVHADEPLSAERLAAGLWGDDVAARAVQTVQVYVSRLRKALGGSELLVTTPAGYRLMVDPEQIDAVCFERQVAAGRQALADGRASRAGELLREALALWRGAPLAEFAWAPFAPTETSRLEELHVAALEARVEADLGAGWHAELVAELRQLTSRHPWRERLHGQLMLALYRSGRQAEALEAYRRAREVLVEQLGIDPGTELQDLNQAILVHDPALEAPRATVSAAFDRRHALSAPPNRTIGRGREVAAIGEQLRAGSMRLLTLTGPGGVGKSRLALEVARLVEADFADGAYVVSLDAVQRPQDVAAAIVESLGVIPLAGESPEQAIGRFLAGKHLLLVLDNCEHVLAAAPLIASLVAACPAVSVLATSREPLTVHAEHRYPVSPLALPASGMVEDQQTLAAVDAVALFCERAQAHDTEFELTASNAAAIANICRRLDGLPLAIELAAVRCGLLSPGEIAERLHAALGSGARDAPARQQTLRATIDWSYDLLNDTEKACFARFAVFAGGATTHTAETVTASDLDTLDRVVAKSLLARRPHGQAPTRLAMLETIRDYASERLAADADQAAVRERHYRYFLSMAAEHATDRALMTAGRADHLARLDADIDNLHAALAWVVGQGRVEAALALVNALGTYWLMRHRVTDALNWIDRALSLPGADVHTKLRVGALLCRSWCLWPLGRAGAHRAAVTVIEAEAIAHGLGDPLILSRVLRTRADHESARGHLDAAEGLADEAIRCAHAADNEWEVARALRARARAASTATERRARVETAASRLNEVGNIFDLANLFNSAAYGALLAGCEHDATRFVERATPFARALDNPLLWPTLQGNLGLAALLTGDTDTAHDAFREELSVSRQLVARPIAAEGLLGLAAIEAAHGNAERAARLLGAATAHRDLLPEDTIVARIGAGRFEDARMQCPADTWDAAVREGGTLSIEDAIAYALQEPARAG